MTYKRMIEGVVERECIKWVESFIESDGFAMVDKDGRVYASVIYDWNDKVVWVSTEEVRNLYNIKEFKIA